MTAPKVLVIGPVGDEAALRESFARDWGAGTPEITTRPNYPPGLQLTSDDVVAFDLVLLFVDPAAPSRDTLWLLRGVVGTYPYLPVLALGEPQHFRDRFYALRATRYLRADATPQGIVRESRNALEATWWSGLQQADKPTLIVAADGRIMRANSAARERFGQDVLGKPYLGGVEGDGSSGFTAHHPIQQARTTRRATCRSHPYRQGDRQMNHHLVCVPVLGLRNEVPAVAVLIEDLDRWMGIFDASKQLASFDRAETLFPEIVKSAAALGYERVRLFRYEPATESMRGVESVGFRPDPAFVEKYGMERAEYFKTRFVLPLRDDEPSLETKESELPRLCIHWPGEEVRGEDGRVLVRHYGHRNCEEVLDKSQVSRWIDIPLLVPAAGGGSVFWGKLSIDNGPNSDSLDARDVACLTLFAIAASSAIGIVERLEAQRKHVDLFRAHAQEMARPPASAAQGSTPVYALGRLSELYQKLTGADEMVYLEWKQGRDFRCRDDVPVAGASESQAQEALARCGLLDAIAARFDAEGNWTGREAIRCEVGGPSGDDPEVGPGYPWGSAACIPLVSQSKMRGVFVALSRGRNAFPAAVTAAVDQFVDTAALGYELAELQQGQRWWDKAIEQILPNMPHLAQTSTDDEAFAACLSAILSAGTGLWWNRVMVFSTVAAGVGPGHARLVHAVGGCGEADHKARQEEATAQYPSLRQLLDLRRADRVPKDGAGRVDSLYHVCLEWHAPAKEAPIEVVFNPWEENSWDAAARGSSRDENPLGWLLERDNPSVPVLPIDLAREPSDWFRRMERERPGMFPPSLGKLYAFPLWAAYDHRRRPLGLVLVDMIYQPQVRLENIIPATRLILDLAATMLALGCQERLNYGMVRLSSMLEHANQLKEDWDDLYRTIEKALAVGPPASGDRFDALLERGMGELLGGCASGRLAEVAASLQGRMKKIDEAMLKQARTHQALTDQVRDRVKNEIPDVLSHLDGLVARYNEVARRGFITLSSKLRGAGASPAIRCDPLVFDHLFENLIQNAASAAGPGRVQVVVELEVEEADDELTRSGFERLVAVRFTDNGPGIPEKRARRLFLDGFSFPPREGEAKKKDRGRGLPLCRAQLRTFHGDLYWEPTPGDAPLQGATFCAVFGIPSAPKQPSPSTSEPARPVAPQGILA